MQMGEEFTKLLRTDFDLVCNIAGGFWRDAINGKPIKDMDVYLQAKSHNIEEVKATAKAIYDKLGYEFMCHRTEVLANDPAGGGYDETLLVFSTTKCPEGTVPIDLIFTPMGVNHPLTFDLAICNIHSHLRTWGRNAGHPFNIRVSEEFKRDIEDKTITVMMSRDALTNYYKDGYAEMEGAELENALRRLFNHIDRVKEKYPDFTVCVHATYLGCPQGVQVYKALQEAGYIGNPGEILPAAGQDAAGDEVRLEDRNAVEQLAVPDEERARRQGVDALLEAYRGELQGGAQVPPRLIDDARGDWVNWHPAPLPAWGTVPAARAEVFVVDDH